MNDTALLVACERRGKKLKFRSGRGKLFSNVDVILKLAKLREGEGMQKECR
jgi:hypothetical protein